MWRMNTIRDAGRPRRLDDLDDAFAVTSAATLDLPQDPDLHVVDDQREPPRIDRVLEALRDLQPVRSFHAPET